MIEEESDNLYSNNQLFQKDVDLIFTYFDFKLTFVEMAKLIGFSTIEFHDYYEYIEPMPDEKYGIFRDYYDAVLIDDDNAESNNEANTKEVSKAENMKNKKK